MAEPPLQVFVQELRARGVQPLSVGHVIVATFEPHETVVLQAIKELGLELEVIFNKGAVMVLPTGVNKATGLLAGLAEFGISSDAAVGIGDAENDHAFLEICGCGVVVQNALPLLKEHAQIVIRGRNGTGVIELIDELLATPSRTALRALRLIRSARQHRDMLRISRTGNCLRNGAKRKSHFCFAMRKISRTEFFEVPLI